MTTYNLAVYSALYGPIAIEKADSKKDLLNKMVDYIKQYQANAIERFIDLLRANVQKPVAPQTQSWTVSSTSISFVSTTTLKNHSSSSNSTKTHQTQISNSYIGIVKTAKNS